jgi:hypothetical protein
VNAPSGGVIGDGAGPWSALSAQPVGKPLVRLPYIDAIWRTRGDITLDAPLAAEEAFARLDPLFQTPGTTHTVDGDTLRYTKANPGAQDPLATFTRGTLQITEHGRLLYDLSSTALLLCFLAPLLFLAFAQLAVAANAWEKSGIEASEKSEKDKDEAKPVRKLNPIDEFLGAPAPEDPNKKKDDKKKDDPHSPTPAYVLAGLFFAIYLVGRALEPWLIRRRLRKALTDGASSITPSTTPVESASA